MLNEKETRTYINVLADGTFRVVVPEGTEGAVRRDWDSKDGKTKGTKFERVYESVEGLITNVMLYDGDYGTNLQLSIDDGELVSLGIATPFGEDIMKKLPNVDFDKKVKLVPYSFEDDNGRTRRGITIYQGHKIDNFFYDKEKREPVNGYPIPEGDTKTYGTDDWKIFYLKARKFLVDYTMNNCPKFNVVKEETKVEVKSEDNDEESEINPESIPF
jgi:hypothetical protein